ncbi:Isoprenoid synthase domain containing protein [Naviculisporaceae sp. PSN 640]
MGANNPASPSIPPSTLASIRDTIAHFYTSVTDGSPFDASALTPTPYFEELLPAVVKALQSSSLAPFLPPKYQSQIVAATLVTAEMLAHHPLPQQIVMAQINLFFVYTEDILDNAPGLLQSFLLKVASREPAGDPVLDWFVLELAPSLYTHFPPIVASMAVTAGQEMLNGMVIESSVCLGVKKNDSSHLGDLKLAPVFPDWLRNKTGMSELYAVIVFGGGPSIPEGLSQFTAAIPCIPDFILLTNAINDVISFYKEALAGEQGNYVDMRAHRDGTDLLVALRTVADEGIAARNRIVQMLKDRGASREFRDMFDAYVTGLTKFHTNCPRYRVAELVRAVDVALDSGL